MGCSGSILNVEDTTTFQVIMNNYQFKEIIVLEDFEVKNGVLRLDRDCYLSIVKFLDSSTVRKV
jgi:hypothetical protein